VVLPKLGRAVLMRRPTPMWFIFRGRLPQSLAVRAFPSAASPAVAGPDGVAANPAEELALLADWIFALLEEVMAAPRVALDPGPDEISPDVLDSEDVNFIIRWAYGETGPGGEDGLEGFRGQRTDAAPGASGSRVVVPAE
ncbi:MAG TPA: hypothetical protein VKU44_07125, partial [Terriglobia bacterium]|nr:hypothetical protein [Terriglobia bacterium]